MEVDGFEAVRLEPSEVDTDASVGGLVGPGVVEYGRGCGGEGVDEGQFMVGGFVEVDNVFDDPEEVSGEGFVAGLLQQLAVEGGAGVLGEFDPSAGLYPVVVLIRPRQQDVPIVEAEAGYTVLEAYAVTVEGDHGPGEFIRRRGKRI